VCATVDAVNHAAAVSRHRTRAHAVLHIHTDLFAPSASHRMTSRAPKKQCVRVVRYAAARPDRSVGRSVAQPGGRPTGCRYITRSTATGTHNVITVYGPTAKYIGRGYQTNLVSSTPSELHGKTANKREAMTVAHPGSSGAYGAAVG